MATGQAMELQKIKELIDVLTTSDLAELEFAEGDQKLRLVRRARPEISKTGVLKTVMPPHTLRVAPTASPATPETPDAAFPAISPGLVRSPLFGIVHLTPTPDAPAYVRPGDLVQPGQVICVVEAMKIFHEVKADRRARIEEVLVKSAQEVEAGETLFCLTPLD